MNKEILKDRLPYLIATVLVVMALLIIVFKMGTFVGFKRGTFACQWGENYRDNFAGQKHDFFMPPPMMMNENQPRPHGLFGTVIKNENNSIVMKDENNEEMVVLTDDNTKIFSNEGKISQSQIKPENQIVVIGRPNNKGQVEAKIIRVEYQQNTQPESNATTTNQK